MTEGRRRDTLYERPDGEAEGLVVRMGTLLPSALRPILHDIGRRDLARWRSESPEGRRLGLGICRDRLSRMNGRLAYVFA